MYQIRSFTGKVERSYKKAILKLVEQDPESITALSFTKDSPLYSYLAKYEVLKVEEYLKRVNNKKTSEMRLIVAEASNKIVGYLLYHENLEARNEVSISSVIISKKHRKKGLLTKMINHLKADGKSIGLSCSIDKVDMYAQLGFEVYSTHGAHIGMTYGPFGEVDRYISIDDDWFRKTYAEPLTVELRYLNKKLGDAVVTAEFEELNKNTNEETVKAQRYLESCQPNIR